MTKLATLALALALSGCAGILANSPTFEYCDKISYTRTGNQVDVQAHCSLPIGGGALPIPLPK